ncbi:hypothetical protein DE146DRAFT_620541, partial [Phaeosphaeria sp. MPI-PUGE-AT-0046c]
PANDNMSVYLDSEAPTFQRLNEPQKRALILRDELRYLERHHLDLHIEGIGPVEPPQYKRINGIIQPPLNMVTLKDIATHFDLGNVYFDKNGKMGKGIFRAYLTVEDGAFELRTEAAVPLGDANHTTVPIHSFVAGNMVPLFEAKFKAIWARKNQINEMRQVAFNMASQQPVEEFRQGEVCCFMDFSKTIRLLYFNSKKRNPGDPVAKHSTNTRDQVGLESIPQDAKAATFNAVPSQIKVDFFNNIVRTAFPNFDNLMISSWNVVSIYSNVGTDFPELHKSIVELKSVLQDFEESFGAPVSRRDPKFRKDFAPQDDGNGDAGNDGDDEDERRRSKQPKPDVTQDELKESSLPPSGPAASSTKPQDGDDIHTLFNEPEMIDSKEMPPPQHIPDHSTQMPPPRLMPRQQAPKVEATKRIRGNSAVRSSPKLSVPTLEHSSSRVSSPYSGNTSFPNPRKRPRDSSASSQDRATQSPKLHRHEDDDDDNVPPNPPPKRLTEMSTAALRTLYHERRDELVNIYGALHLVPEHYRLQMREFVDELKARGEKRKKEKERRGVEGEDGMDGDMGTETEMPKFLGNSVLGGKKSMGMAPVAPMVHLRREGGHVGGTGE